MAKAELFPDPDELNEMISDLAQEHGCPYPIFPDLVQLGPIPDHVRGLNVGMANGQDGVSLYKAGQRWRRKLIAELERSPEWVAQWRAAVALNERIEELCRERGYRFEPHETTPWQCDDEPCPWPGSSAGALSWPAAQKLRRQLIAELRQAEKR
jgi:hypothetical protein